jgi:hypothetical protein
MAKKQIVLDQKAIDERVRQGDGQGHGGQYDPWIKVYGVSLDSHKYRELGWKTGREHHLFSSLEFDVFCILDWLPNVLDVREQFPLLPIDETLALAAQMRITHPNVQYKRTSPYKYIVMTTDLLIDIQTDTGVRQVALDIKPSGELDKRRTLEKLELARRYWAARGIEWRIITQHDYNHVIAKNLKEKLRAHRSPTGKIRLPENELDELGYNFTEIVRTGDMSLSKAARTFEQQNSLDPGSGITLAWHLIATKKWIVDLSVLLQTSRKLSLITTAFDNDD